MNTLEAQTAYIGSTEIQQVRLGDQLVLAPNGDILWYKANEIPSLDLRFADDKSLVDATTGTNLIDFTRASSGTYVGSDGLIKTATTNLLLGSEEINNATYWNHARVTPSPNAAIAPNGTQTADFVAPTVDNGTHYAVQLLSTPANTTYVSSFFLKAAGYSQAFIRVAGSGWDVTGTSAYIDLNTGNVTGSNAQLLNVQQYPNGWWRIWHTIVTDATSSTSRGVLLALGDNGNIVFTGDPTKGIYIWGAQLEQSSTVGEYIPTTSTINSAPRFDHDPTTGESLGLLVEESRTNEVRQSQAFDTVAPLDQAWLPVGDGVTVTPNQTVAPDGTVTADLLTANAGASDKGIQDFIGTSVAGTTYTVSVFAKAASSSFVRLHYEGGGGTAAFAVNLATGTPILNANTTDVSITPYLDGWYRISTTKTAVGATGMAIRFLVCNSDGTTPGATGSVYVWGAQFETGAFPTSYIPTTEGSTVTRAADVASISGSNFSSWYRQDEGSAFVDFTVNGVTAGANHFVYDFSDGTIQEEIFLNYQPSRNARWVARISSNQVTQDSLGSNLDRVKHAFGMESNNYMVARDGVLSTGSSQSGMPAIASLELGNRFNGSFPYNGTISRLVYWPARLPDSTLQGITQE